MTRLATLKHINSKNADYGAAEQYLLFEHDEFTMKPVLDEAGRLIPRRDFRLDVKHIGFYPVVLFGAMFLAVLAALAVIVVRAVRKKKPFSRLGKKKSKLPAGEEPKSEE